jgi:hypothetical protein
MSTTLPGDAALTAQQDAGPDAPSAWLAAYALGLTRSSRSDQQRLADLRDAAHPCVAVDLCPAEQGHHD